MGDITIPLPIFEIMVQPEPTGPLRLSDDIQQTLSANMGYDGEGRRPLKCGKTGTLFVCSAPAAAIVKYPASGAFDEWIGGNVKTSEVLIHSLAANGGNIFVHLDAALGATNYWTLTPGDSLQLALTNLNRLHITIAVDTEVVEIVYTT